MCKKGRAPVRGVQRPEAGDPGIEVKKDLEASALPGNSEPRPGAGWPPTRTSGSDEVVEVEAPWSRVWSCCPGPSREGRKGVGSVEVGPATPVALTVTFAVAGDRLRTGTQPPRWEGGRGGESCGSWGGEQESRKTLSKLYRQGGGTSRSLGGERSNRVFTGLRE